VLPPYVSEMLAFGEGVSNTRTQAQGLINACMYSAEPLRATNLARIINNHILIITIERVCHTVVEQKSRSVTEMSVLIREVYSKGNDLSGGLTYCSAVLSRCGTVREE
jgi:hypothetical protein